MQYDAFIVNEPEHAKMTANEMFVVMIEDSASNGLF